MKTTTSVLFKLLVRGFYYAHAGLFFSFFILFGMSLVFVQVLNQTHLSETEIVKHNLLLVIEVASSPEVAGLLMILWLLITIKSWTYMYNQLGQVDHQFLHHSVNSLDKKKQITVWLLINLAIASPMLLYLFFAMVIGFLYNFYQVPLIAIIILFSFCVVGAFLLFNWLHKPTHSSHLSWPIKSIMGWKKPLFSLSLYHLVYNLKISLVVTKLISIILLAGGILLLHNADNTLQAGGIIVLATSIAHSFLLFESFQFERVYLIFTRNFPAQKVVLYANEFMVYLLVTLPESLWMISKFEPTVAIRLLLLNWVTGMLLRSLLYLQPRNRGNYLTWVFCLFIILFAVILSKLFWTAIAVNTLLSIFIFQRFYDTLDSATTN